MTGGDEFSEKFRQIVSQVQLWKLIASRMRSTTVSSAGPRTTALLTQKTTGRTPIDDTTDIYAICDVIKYFFRTLPDPVIPSVMYFAFIDSASEFELLFLILFTKDSLRIVFQELRTLSLVWHTSGASSENSLLRILIF